jgi:hypothetical protein
MGYYMKKESFDLRDLKRYSIKETGLRTHKSIDFLYLYQVQKLLQLGNQIMMCLLLEVKLIIYFIQRIALPSCVPKVQ